MKYLIMSNGTLTERSGVVTSAGASSAGELVQLDGAGKIDSTVLPTGVGEDVQMVQASEALAAGDLVNIFDGGAGVFRARKADGSTTGKRAHGFVQAGFASAAQARVYFEGTDTQQTAVPPGELWLSDITPGKATGTAPVGSGKTVQRVGFGTSATTFNFQAGEPTNLA